jgi:Fic family protein
MGKTLNEITNTLHRINTHPEYSSVLRNEYLSFLRDEAHRNSIEVALLGSKEREPDTKEYQERLRKVYDARNFLYSNGISLSNLSTLGKIIEPEKNAVGLFRLTDVTFCEGSESIPPLEIYSKMEDLIYRLTSLEDRHTILKAADAHLSLIQIQPFSDGNKRVARILQNFCLEQDGFPPIIIPQEEGDLYKRIRNNALQDRYSGKSNPFKYSVAEEIFNEYLLTKELNSARRLEEELSSKRNYSIILNGIRDKGILRTIKNSLRGETKRVNVEGSTFSEKGIRGREYEISYQGPLESSVMNGALEKLSKKYTFGFEIKYK